MRKIVIILFVILLVGCSVEYYPDEIMPIVTWRFNDTLPDSLDEFEKKLYKQNKIFQNQLPEGVLSEEVGLKRLYVKYNYTIQEGTESNGDLIWKDLTAKILIESDNESLINSELLYKIHKKAVINLGDQDHSFFEGLYLLTDEFVGDVPTYEMYLGS